MSDPFAVAGELALEVAALQVRLRRVLLQMGKALASEARGACDEMERSRWSMCCASRGAVCRGATWRVRRAG